jgi:hypothetical protein
MLRFLSLALLSLLFATNSHAQTTDPNQPSIELSSSGSSGKVTVSGKINLPPGWKVSFHTLCVRHLKDGTNVTVNLLIPIDGENSFKTSIDVPKANYTVWAVIDVKDSNNREKEIKSMPKPVMAE